MMLKLLPLIVVAAVQQGYREVPVSLVLPAEQVGGIPLLTRVDTGKEVPCQVERIGQESRLWWLVRDLKQGEQRKYKLNWAMGREAQPDAEVSVAQAQGEDASLEVRKRGALLTRYVYEGANKPYCYPLIGPTGAPVTRSYPMEAVEGEAKDHPHHRSGFWWTHGEVNGIDFWSQSDRAGKTVHREFTHLGSGPALGVIRAANDWRNPADEPVLEDVRELRFYNTERGTLVDFDITLRATVGDVKFGDTKEGSFGFRVAHTMKLKGGQGHILNATGVTDKACWGKAAAWCDYSGPVDGKIVGIAILDSPTNLRHPTYWHVRDYGLFAANPFGLKYFIGDKTGKGNYTLPNGESLTFRYRVWLHEGDAAQADVAEVFAEYANPPKVTLEAAKH